MKKKKKGKKKKNNFNSPPKVLRRLHKLKDTGQQGCSGPDSSAVPVVFLVSATASFFPFHRRGGRGRRRVVEDDHLVDAKDGRGARERAGQGGRALGRLRVVYRRPGQGDGQRRGLARPADRGPVVRASPLGVVPFSFVFVGFRRRRSCCCRRCCCCRCRFNSSSTSTSATSSSFRTAALLLALCSTWRLLAGSCSSSSRYNGSVCRGDVCIRELALALAHGSGGTSGGGVVRRRCRRNGG